MGETRGYVMLSPSFTESVRPAVKDHFGGAVTECYDPLRTMLNHAGNKITAEYTKELQTYVGACGKTFKETVH